MNISFERSGGFAGLVMTTAVDTAKLPASDAQQAKLLVEAASFFQLPSTIIAAANQPDRFQYEITVADGDRQHTVTVGESAVPGTLRPLLDWLMDAARQTR